jgi:hypothetical protein
MIARRTSKKKKKNTNNMETFIMDTTMELMLLACL